MNRGRKLGLLISIIVLASAAGIFIKRDAVADWYKLRGYTPSSDIVRLADNTTLREEWRRLFYVNHPVIAEPDVFNANCRDRNEQTIVLGCYLTGQSGIYVLNVTDERLEGIKEVTVAHEVLHAAYERLSGRERDRVDTMLTQAFVNLKNNRVRETIELYRKKDPSIVTNELHSILGTEVRELPDELEEYYSRYFINRMKIVEYSEHYEQAFVERHNAVREYAAQLARLKDEISSLSTRLKATEAELSATKAEMETLRSSGQTDAYNAMVPGYNAKANQYNRDYDRLSEMIVEYNDIVQKHNSIVAEEAELIDAIDSRDVVPDQM